MTGHSPATKLVNVDSHNSILMREQLIREITGLERQLEQLKINDEDRDFSQQQTYREMIHSRKGMLTSLPFAPNR
ncbi:hypothetical protein G8770_19065 [Aestuariicella hydrocarbonica]|uniref:Uncharacterized protein n=1 Tax=Pseudomaricurvus hydrocarbonicus TaxID=1470433 RepID=A0A9E5T440_9GAMM|nr:hypothetical protein [Aestuariicella hydrocarbonica]NHO67652.1 hypothetical protein [Aestuariicella hydrocarbonica]